MRDRLFLLYRSSSEYENEEENEEEIISRKEWEDLSSKIKKERQYALFNSCYKIVQHSGVTRPSFNMWGDSRGGGDFKLLASYILSCIFVFGNIENIDLAFGYLIPYANNTIFYPNLLLSVQQLYVVNELKSYNISFFDNYIFNYVDYVAEVVKLFIFLEELIIKLQDNEESTEESDVDEGKLDYDYTYLEDMFSKINENMRNISNHKKVTISITDTAKNVEKEILSKIETHNILILKVIQLLTGIELSENTVFTKNMNGYIVPEVPYHELDDLPEDYSYFTEEISYLDTLDNKEITSNNSLFMDCCLKFAIAYNAGFTNSGGDTGITSNPRWSFLSEVPLLKAIRNFELITQIWKDHEMSFPIDTPLHIIYFYTLISSNPPDTTAIVPINTPEFPWSLLKEKGFLYAKHMYYTTINSKDNVYENKKQKETRKRYFSEVGESSSEPTRTKLTKVDKKPFKNEEIRSSLFGSLEDMNAFFVSNPCYKLKFDDYETVVRSDKTEHLRMMFLKSVPTESQLISLFRYANSEKIMSFLFETSVISGYNIYDISDSVKPHLTEYMDNLMRNFEYLKESFKIENEKFKFGIEIECCIPSDEYAKLNLKYFDMVDDSSIICDEKSVRTEFVYRGTFTLSDLDNEELIDEVKKIGKMMIEGDDNSCGTHVHMSCEMISQKKQIFIKSLQKSWLLLQDNFIFEWYGEEREENEYCVPNKRVLEPNEYEKYMMLNLKPTFYKENEVHVEFRGLPYVDWWKYGTGHLKTYLNSLCDVWNRAAFASRLII